MSEVNKQLLDALKEIQQFNMKRTWSPKIGELCASAIAAAEQAQQPWGQLLEMARQVIRDGHVHDVGGGDLAVTTCEAFEGLDAFLRQHFPETLGELTAQEQKWLEADLKARRAQQAEPDGYADVLGDLLTWIESNVEWSCLPLPVAKAMALHRILLANAQKGDT